VLTLHTASKNLKISELDRQCTESILGGFYSSASGQEIIYGYDEKDQSNLNFQLNAINAGIETEPVYWKGKGQQSFLPYTFEQFKQICSDAKIHFKTKYMKYQQLLQQVNEATTQEEIDAIVW
jgi:hypothetical protein